MPATPAAERADDTFASLIADSVKESLTSADDTEPLGDPTPDAAHVGPEDTVQEADTAPADDVKDESAPAPEKTDEPALPEGMVAVPPIEKPATEFKVLDDKGEIEAPALLIEFTANGKPRKEPLDKVVKLAQWGVYNHERHLQAEQAFAKAQQADQTVQQMQARVQEYEQAVEAMLEDPDKYLDAQAEYAKRNTPEARLAAKEAALAEQNERIAFTEAQQQGGAFMDEKVGPALKLIADNFPTVSEDDLAARLLLFANPYMVHTKFGSVIHPDAHPAIAKAIAEDIFVWAQQVHEARLADKQATVAEAQKEVAKVRVESQKAKNLVAKAVKPTGRATAEKKTRPAPKDADEAHDQIIRDTLEAMGLAG